MKLGLGICWTTWDEPPVKPILPLLLFESLGRTESLSDLSLLELDCDLSPDEYSRDGDLNLLPLALAKRGLAPDFDELKPLLFFGPDGAALAGGSSIFSTFFTAS